MPMASIEIDLQNPKDYIEILKDTAYSNKNIRIAANGKKLKISVDADSPKELVAAMDSVVKKLLIIGSAESAIKNRR